VTHEQIPLLSQRTNAILYMSEMVCIIKQER
jgi:hypothetical protein